MTTEEMVEGIAKTLYYDECGATEAAWNARAELQREYYRDYARSAVTYIEPTLTTLRRQLAEAREANTIIRRQFTDLLANTEERATRAAETAVRYAISSVVGYDYSRMTSAERERLESDARKEAMDEFAEALNTALRALGGTEGR